MFIFLIQICPNEWFEKASFQRAHDLSTPCIIPAACLVYFVSLRVIIGLWNWGIAHETVTEQGMTAVGRKTECTAGGSLVKNPPANAGDAGSILGLGRSPGEGNGNPLQYTCLGNPMDKGAWWATVHGVTKSGTQLSKWAPVQSKQS